MRSGKWPRRVLVAVGLVALLVAPAGAERFFEGQIWGEEFEDGPAELSRIELFQAINDERFASYEEVHLVFQLELGSVPAIREGVVRVRARVFKADGSTIKLPLMSAPIDQSLVLVQRSAPVTLERGDVVRWRARFSGVPTVSQGGACQVVLGVANKPID